MNILWDFDGTLFDTYPVYTKLMKQVLGPAFSEDEIYRQLKISFEHAFAVFDLTRQQMGYFFALYRRTPALSFRPFPGVKEVLRAADTNVIMTHNDRKSLLKMLKLYRLNDCFAEAVTGDDGFPRKPDPAAYRYLSNRHPVDLVVGDRRIDIIPGKKLGMKTCLFQNHEPGADFYVDDYQQFFDSVRI
ncbi:MAG: HAD hydrolase-like protein [Sporolactobacillus sp.]|jgi:phosphoglycolate phosphatase|nr:HAD hydrolase-like protein [Sporolactobacillus sp.]